MMDDFIFTFLLTILIMGQPENNESMTGAGKQKSILQALNEINAHLKEQDKKLNKIEEVVYEIDREIV